MSSDSAVGADLAPPGEARPVLRLLDSVFGFVVWAVHLLIVYVATAVACQLGLGSQPGSVQATVVGILCVVTLAVAGIVVWHAIRRYRQQKQMRDRGFLARIAVGHDAVAALAIVWQLMPLLMVPLCR
jgi:hypothetical protein